MVLKIFARWLKGKTANRDILTLFFFIILENVLPGPKKLYLCFALPLHDYDIRCNKVKWQIEHGIGKVPNRFDSDLIQPYFWIELEVPTLSDGELYIIDPIAHLGEREMVLKTHEDQFVPYLSTFGRHEVQPKPKVSLCSPYQSC